MIRITTRMAATISREALIWYADLLSRDLTQFTAADFPTIAERSLERYIGQIRQGWCDIRVKHRGKPPVYSLPVAAQEQTPAPDTTTRDAFCLLWQATVAAKALPAFGAGHYDSLRTLYADIPTADFDRLLLAKLLQNAGSAEPSKTIDGLIQWLTKGIGMAQRATTSYGSGPQVPAGPAPKSVEELYQEQLPYLDRLAARSAALANR
jgi:hypothetical protein